MRTMSVVTATALAVAGAGALASAGHASAGPVVGNKPSYGPDVSATGRYVVFASDATNLVAGDTNGKRDVFIRDLQAKTTRLVSKAGAKLGNRNSYSPTVSDNGRYVAFHSEATNLVTGDTNGVADVFRADLQTGRITRLSVAKSGLQGNGKSENARLSGSGDAIVFASAATNLVAGDTNRVRDVFLRDVTAKSIRRISLTPGGFQNVKESTDAEISNNGAVVTWNGPVGNHRAVMRWDRSLGKATMVDDTADDLGPIRPSNAGVAYAWAYHETEYDAYYITVKLKPASASYEVGDFSGNTYWGVTTMDTSKWGAMVVFDNPDGGTDVRDASTSSAAYDPPLASTASGWKGLSMSADGNWVAGQVGAQIKLWSWRTGAITTVSIK